VAGRAPAPPPPRTTAGAPAWQPPPNAAGAAASVAGHAPIGGGADIAALTAALREGLAVHNLPPESLVLTPALMRLLGRLVHEATRGTVDLLVARAALKREIRAEVTMIVTRENNPLKFSPSAEVALGHLLSPPARGFMDSDKAMRDAFDDLRAHQFGFLAGMRAALEGILKRFDPAILEGKLTQKKSMLSSLIPAKRKAQMWDVFTELYGQISSEASDDFHELFGKEFLRAYNEYIDQLAKDRP
jgi:FHA domain-containing protein